MSTMEKEELLKFVGKKIQQIRLSKGLTQVDLVGKIEGEIDTTNISRIEAGRTNPTIFTLYSHIKVRNTPSNKTNVAPTSAITSTIMALRNIILGICHAPK